MAFFEVHFFSDVLQVESTVNVILPERKKVEAAGGATKVLYLLHGYSDDHTAWVRNTSIERYADKCNLAVIMPAVNHSFYANELYGECYWDYIAEELPAEMHHFFHLSDKPEDTFVAGLSMGGYGAMKLALTHPERFSAAASFSGAVNLFDQRKLDDRVNRASLERIFGDVTQARQGGNDLFDLLVRHADAPAKPRLYVACGNADFLYQDNLKFVPALKQHNWDVTYYEEAGVGHEWAFWDRQIKFFISWMLNQN